jgi:hypothetical protein
LPVISWPQDVHVAIGSCSPLSIQILFESLPEIQYRLSAV